MEESNTGIKVVVGILVFLIVAVVASLLTYFLWWVPSQIQTANSLALQNAKSAYPWLSDISITTTGAIRFFTPAPDGSIKVTIDDAVPSVSSPSITKVDIQHPSSNQTVVTFYPPSKVTPQSPTTQSTLPTTSTSASSVTTPNAAPITPVTSLSKFKIVPKKSISGHNGTVVMNSNPEACAAACLNEPASCLSFDYNLKDHNCFLQDAKTTSPNVTVVDNPDIDTYDLM